MTDMRFRAASWVNTKRMMFLIKKIGQHIVSFFIHNLNKKRIIPVLIGEQEYLFQTFAPLSVDAFVIFKQSENFSIWRTEYG